MSAVPDDGDRQHVVDAVAASLTRSAELGFLGSMPLDEQVDHALGFAWAVEKELGASPKAVVDLGSGGGVPGLVLMAWWPQASVVLVDANDRRTEFLAQEAERIGRSGNTVVRGRAEDLGREPAYREQFDVVVARSFAAPAPTAECATAFVQLGGLVLVSEPPDGAPDRWDEDKLQQLGLASLAHLRYQDRFGYQALQKVSPCPNRFPRRTGVPSKRPLF